MIALALCVHKVDDSLVNATELLDNTSQRIVDLRDGGLISLNLSNIGIAGCMSRDLFIVASIGFYGRGNPPGHCSGKGGMGIDA